MKMLIKLNDLIWKDEDKEKWLIANLLPCDSVGILYGFSGLYKSFIALDIACHIASGIDFHGMRTEQGEVVYLSSDGDNGIKQRINAWLDAHPGASPSVLLDNISFLNFDLVSEFTFRKNNEVLSWLIEGIKAEGSNVKLIVVDQLSMFNEGDEDKEETVIDFVGTCKHVSVELGCSVLFIYHDCIRSSNYLPYADFSFHIKGRKPMKVELEIEKMREAASGTSFIVSLQEVEFEAGYGSSLAVKDCSSSSR